MSVPLKQLSGSDSQKDAKELVIPPDKHASWTKDWNKVLLPPARPSTAMFRIVGGFYAAHLADLGGRPEQTRKGLANSQNSLRRRK